MSGYWAIVAMKLVRLVLVFAVLLMPLGMTPASASGAVDHASAAMPMGHCDPGAPKHHGAKGISECTMACSAALPAAVPSDAAGPLIVAMPVKPGAAQILRGLQPDPATPPPRLS